MPSKGLPLSTPWSAKCRHWTGSGALRRTCALKSVAFEGSQEILDKFWQARGVSDSEKRATLIDFACTFQQEPERDVTSCNLEGRPLPGINSYWQLQTSAECRAQIGAVSTRLLELNSLLGNRCDINVSQMLITEPRLLTATLADLVDRLVVMRVTEGAEDMDIIKVVEAQPSLLVQGSTSKDCPEAWGFGLASCGDSEWTTNLQQLAQYQDGHGDAHVGFRRGDDPELTKFARMQRAEYARGHLSEAKVDELHKVGFIFDADDAEWDRWANELERVQILEATQPLPLAGSDDFLLTNWCSVQRIANRSAVLSEERRARLNALGFDWTGADALS